MTYLLAAIVVLLVVVIFQLWLLIGTITHLGYHICTAADEDVRSAFNKFPRKNKLESDA